MVVTRVAGLMPWREERHVRVTMATDASEYGWGFAGIRAPVRQLASDYWSPEEQKLDIATKEAMAVEKMLRACKDQITNARVDVLVDNMAVVNTWNNQSGKSVALNKVMKQLFYTTEKLNVLLHLEYIPSEGNPADSPSRRLSLSDCQLSCDVWSMVQRLFGGDDGHSCDLMALDSNAMKTKQGKPLPHFTPYPSPGSAGVNVFSQNLYEHADILVRPYVFPPLVLVGPLLRFLEGYRQSCTIIVLDTYPRMYWWPLLHRRSRKSAKKKKKREIINI